MGKQQQQRRRLKKIFFAAALGGGLLALPGCVTSGGLQSRPLTPRERDMAREVFGDQIEYDKVKVYNGAPKVAGVIPLDGMDAIAPSGNIFLVDKDSQHPDMSQAGAANRKLLIHEMTHVWQYQQGRNVNLEAAGLFVRNGFSYGKGIYAYDLYKTKKFNDLNIEQQAEMVADYFELREMPPSEWPADRLERMARLEKLLKPSLPLGTTVADTRPPPPPSGPK